MPRQWPAPRHQLRTYRLGGEPRLISASHLTNATHTPRALCSRLCTLRKLALQVATLPVPSSNLHYFLPQLVTLLTTLMVPNFRLYGTQLAAAMATAHAECPSRIECSTVLHFSIANKGELCASAANERTRCFSTMRRYIAFSAGGKFGTCMPLVCPGAFQHEFGG